MSKRSLLSWRIIDVARRSLGEAEVRTNRPSILPQPSVSELSDAIKFLVHFKWPASLTAFRSSQTACTMLDHTHHQHHRQSRAESLSRGYSEWAGLQEQEMLRGAESTESDWLKQTTERSLRWKGSDLTPKELLQLMQMMREGGIRPTRDDYSRLLKVCMCLCEQDGLKEAGLHLAVREMIKRAKEDLGKADVSSVVMSSLLPVASSQTQVKKLWRDLVKVSGVESNEYYLHLLEAYLSVSEEDSRAAVSIIMRHLAPNSVLLSPQTFERVLMSSIRNYKLSQALGTYNCMTQRYGIAPSKRVYSRLTKLLADTSDSGIVTESLCQRILADTSAVFGGSPPPWVYAHMSKPLLKLRGLQGYRDMFKLSLQMALDYKGDMEALMSQSWNLSLYYSLIKHSSYFLEESTAMALYLYRKMTSQGVSVTGSTFELLLSLAHKKEHLNTYLTPLLFEMNKKLTKEELLKIREPLLKTLSRIYDYHTVGLTHTRKRGWHATVYQDTPEFISLAAQLLVFDTPLADSSHSHCVDQLVNLNMSSRVPINDAAAYLRASQGSVSDHRHELSRALSA